MIIPLWSGTAALDLRQAYQEGWQRWARDPKQVVLDPLRQSLPGELESQRQMVVHFSWVFKKRLESTQPKDKREFKECIDATVLARNVLLRTHGFSPYQRVRSRR